MDKLMNQMVIGQVCWMVRKLCMKNVLKEVSMKMTENPVRVRVDKE